MLRKLVAFPTVSRDSNLALIHFVRDMLKPHDADVRLTYDDEKRKANLFATLGPRGEPGIVLSGHTGRRAHRGPGVGHRSFCNGREGREVVRPWHVRHEGFIACVLALVPEFAGRGLRDAAASRIFLR